MFEVKSRTSLKTSSNRGLSECRIYELFLVWLKSILLLSPVCALGSGQETSLRHQVFRLYSGADSDGPLIRELHVNHSLDPWREVRGTNSSGDYLVSPQHVLDLKRQLDGSHIRYEVVIDDAERYIEENDPLRSRKREKRSTSVHDFRHKFLSYVELRHFLRNARNSATNAKVELDSIGRSFEGRLTPYVKISSLNDSSRKATIFIDGGIHGREWISPALTVEIIHRLAFNVENDSDVNRLLTMFNWIIVPLVNPDGYSYTFTPGLESRMWRKSRSTSYSSDLHCYGVDLNRNFGFHWNNSPIHGGSSNPCSGTFSGPRSFSEPESRNLRNVLLSNSDTIKAYLSFHSFGQFFLYPWGYSSDVDIEDEEDLMQVASAFSKTMMAKNYEYSVGGSAKILYPAAGGSDDYVRGSVGVKYAYTVELPPHETSRYGFLLPESFVRSVVSDTWDGLKAFAFHLNKRLQPKDHAHSRSDSPSSPKTARSTFISPPSPKTAPSTFVSPPNPKTARSTFMSPPNPKTALSTFMSPPIPKTARSTFIWPPVAKNAQPSKKTTRNIHHETRPLELNSNVDTVQQIRHRPAIQLIQSLWTSRPVWHSRPRNPTNSLRETSSRDIINALVGKI